MRVIASVVPHGARRWARQGGGPAADREGSAPAWVSERRRCTPLRSSGASKVSIQDTTSPVSDASRGVLLANTPFQSLSAQDRRDALEVAASLSGLRAHLLEKDIWVVQTLSVLFDAPFGRDLVFKGSTSLAKAYHAIRRFSEDIDITYDIRGFAPDLVANAGEDALPATRSRRSPSLRLWVGPVNHHPFCSLLQKHQELEGQLRPDPRRRGADGRKRAHYFAMGKRRYVSHLNGAFRQRRRDRLAGRRRGIFTAAAWRYLRTLSSSATSRRRRRCS